MKTITLPAWAFDETDLRTIADRMVQVAKDADDPAQAKMEVELPVAILLRELGARANAIFRLDGDHIIKE